jgi:hypothetical protein
MRRGICAGWPRTGGSPSAYTRTRTSPFAALLASGSRLVSRAGLARETGAKPAVVCAKTDNKNCRFAGSF